MIKILMMIVTGLVLFGISAAASWMMQGDPESEGEGDSEEKTEQVVEDDADNAKPTPSNPQDTVDDMAEPPTVAIPRGISAETVLRLSDSIRKREAELKAREERVERDEKRLRLMLDDMQRARTEITALIEKAETQSKVARQLLEQTAKASAPGNGQTQDSPTANSGNAASTTGQTGIDSEQEQKNLRTVADWLKEMPAETAAKSIQDLVNDGKMEMVVQLLGYLEQRDAAKILSKLPDPTLIPDVATQYRSRENLLRK